MSHNHFKEILDNLAEKYNNKGFIAADPISIPHRFKKKEDIEISGFLAASIAWGNRRSIIKSAEKMMALMGNEPYRFVTEAKGKELKPLTNFVHRTFNSSDLLFFVESLKNIYQNYGGLENVFTEGYHNKNNIIGAIQHFRLIFMKTEHEKRSEKHISDVSKNSAAKRINMYLRWMVRKDNKCVDFGLWQKIPMSELLIPLDVHCATTARRMGLLTRKQHDLKSVMEISEKLRLFRPYDPVYYDYALFGAGIGKDAI